MDASDRESTWSSRIPHSDPSRTGAASGLRSSDDSRGCHFAAAGRVHEFFVECAHVFRHIGLRRFISYGLASSERWDRAIEHSQRLGRRARSELTGRWAAESVRDGDQDQYETVIKKVLPSIVQITTPVGLGSGVVYDTRGDIVTNDHVVGNATTFQVQLSSSSHAVTATLVGSYPTDDLAVIKISSTAGAKPATFGRSSQLQVGQIVLAMGNPLGLTSSVTNGIVSALGRTLTEPTSADSPGATLPNSIQTSAAINPGNSGGALVDLQGQVIGIPTLAATDAQIGGAAAGIGFAIPSDTVRSIADQLISTGKVTNSGRAALGVKVQGITDTQGNNAGVAIASVEAGKAAATAGLEAGDVITELDGSRSRVHPTWPAFWPG